MLKCLIAKMREKGVSLIEILAAVAVFAITVGAISGIFISAVRNQRRILATQELLDQTSYVLEYMGRALRMARKDSGLVCLTSAKNYEVSGAGDSIKFLKFDYETNSNVCYQFYLSGTQIYESKNGGIGVPLTSDKISVNSLKFNLSGDTVGESPNYQPRVTIFLEVEGREVAGSRPKIQIQTSISQRNLDQ
jgi:type II secretory pathway pseudopilin PulG